MTDNWKPSEAIDRMDECDVWYHVYPLGFLGAELENSATGPVIRRLPQLVEWLDYLMDRGVTALLLGPIFESETHGYDVVDPYRIDRRLGTEEDLSQLIDECHRRSLRLALDGVFHHVGRGHKHFQDVLARGSESPWKSWFEIDFDRPGRDGFAYATFEGHDQLVKLNHVNPDVLDWAVDVARYWVERGVDGYRLDAAYALPAPFVSAFSDRVRELKPDLLLVGEVIRGDYGRIVSEMHLSTVTQYELWKGIWSSLNDANFFELAHALSATRSFVSTFRHGRLSATMILRELPRN